MSTEQERFDWIENYLNGTLTEVQKDAFMQQLKTDPTLAQELEMHQMVNEVIVDRALLDLKTKIITEYRPRYRENPFWGGNRGTLFLIGSLVVVSALVVSMFYFQKDPSQVVRTPKVGSQTSAKPPSSTIEIVTEQNKKDLEKMPEPTALSKKAAPIPGNTTTIQSSDPFVASDTIRQSSYSVPLTSEKSVSTVETPTSGKETIRVTPVPVDIPAKRKDEILDCINVQFAISVQVQASCSDSPTGKLSYNPASVKGGVPPYQFSLNNGASFQKNNRFDYLAPGIYYLTIQDSRGCQYTLEDAFEVNSIDCSAPKEYAFSPDLGETWLFPFGEDKSGTLYVFNREGVMVYSIAIRNGFPKEWNGQSNQGITIRMGRYRFVFEEGKGKQTDGYFTILK